MKKGRIVIVEDNAIIALDIEKRLEDMGHCVVGVAATAMEAMHIAEETRPDLVLMDIKLKGEGDGIFAAENIRDRFDTSIIFMTAYSDRSMVERARNVGPDGYLVKPIRLEDLKTAIEDALARE